MYEELVNRLRSAYEADTLDNQTILLESADAIEELSAKYQKALNDLVKLAEPPKEETDDDQEGFLPV